MVLSYDLLKIGLGMLTDRTDKIVRHLLAHIFITADGAAPDSLTSLGGAYSLRLGLDV